MFAVVEWFEEDGRKEHTCVSHRPDEEGAKKEMALYFFTPYDLDKAFTYELVEFELGEPCPMCKRNYPF